MFVTVGSTKFEEMVSAVMHPRVVSQLGAMGYTKLVVQYGNGRVVEPANLEECNIAVEAFPWKEGGISGDIRAASLVICHAGVGTVMECMRQRKCTLVVVNSALMDNHQLEVAEALERDNYITVAYPDTICDVLNQGAFRNLSVYPELDRNLFPRFLDSIV